MNNLFDYFYFYFTTDFKITMLITTNNIFKRNLESYYRIKHIQ